MHTKSTVTLLLTKLFICNALICDNQTSVNISNGTKLPDGAIDFQGVTYKRTEYYIDNETNIEKGCVCAKESCLRKCCPHGFGYLYEERRCVETNEVFNPVIWEDFSFKGASVRASDYFHLVYGIMNCTDAFRIRVGETQYDYVFTKSGKLFVEVPTRIPPWMELTPDNYCVDTSISEDSSGKRTAQIDALICFKSEQKTQNSIYKASCMLVSCVFIVATVCVYVCLPELRNLHGAVLATYLLCLCAGFAGVALMQIMLMYSRLTVDYCIGLTFVIYFFLECAFFWLNVMCYDIWWTFSGRAGVSSLKFKHRFHMYALYAFGIPTLLTILVIALEEADLPRSPWLPMIRHLGCFINGTSKVIYLYGPIIILCLVNIYFFVMTAVKIAQVKKMTSVLKSKESATHNNNTQKFYLYLKLFVVMGINWILEVASAILPQFEEFWRYVDYYNVLIGPIIFVMFVCKKKIFQLLKKRIAGHIHGTNQTTPKDSWKTDTQKRASLDTIRLSLTSTKPIPISISH